MFWTFLVTETFKNWTQTAGKTTNLKNFWCKRLLFSHQKETAYLSLSPRNVLNHLWYHYSQKWYSNNMKNLHKLEFLGLLDNFCVKLKPIFYQKLAHIQKAYRRTPSNVVEPFQSFDPWKCWSFYKSCVGNYKNVKKSKICWLFCGPCCNSFWKTAFISANNTIGQRNQSLLIVFNVLSHEISKNLTKVA